MFKSKNYNHKIRINLVLLPERWNLNIRADYFFNRFIPLMERDANILNVTYNLTSIPGYVQLNYII